MQRDHTTAPQSAATMLNTQATPPRPTAYDKALAFRICDRFGNGERLEGIFTEFGMPDERTFVGWLLEHKELARKFREKSSYSTP